MRESTNGQPNGFNVGGSVGSTILRNPKVYLQQNPVSSSVPDKIEKHKKVSKHLSLSVPFLGVPEKNNGLTPRSDRSALAAHVFHHRPSGGSQRETPGGDARDAPGLQWHETYHVARVVEPVVAAQRAPMAKGIRPETLILGRRMVRHGDMEGSDRSGGGWDEGFRMVFVYLDVDGCTS